MRIAVISFHTCPLSRLGVMDAGGMNVYILSLYKELAKHGLQIDVYTRFRGYEKQIIESSDEIVVSTPLEADELKQKYSAKVPISVVTPGVDHTVFKPRD